MDRTMTLRPLLVGLSLTACAVPRQPLVLAAAPLPDTLVACPANTAPLYVDHLNGRRVCVRTGATP